MNILNEYLKLHEIIWQIDEFHGRGERGLFLLQPVDIINALQGVPVKSFGGRQWSPDGYMPWDAVQKLIDRHRSGTLIAEMANGVTRTEPDTVWEVAG